MPYYKFGKNDIFYNTIETHPKSQFLIHKGKTYYNEEIPELSDHTGNPYGANVDHVKTGDINLYEMNINRKEVFTLDQSSRSMEFDGINDYIKVDIAEKQDSKCSDASYTSYSTCETAGEAWIPYGLDFGKGSFTISAWVKTTDVTDSDRVIFVSTQVVSSNSGDYPLGLIINNGYIKTAINETWTPTSGGAINDGAWHHVVVVLDATSKKYFLYIDGDEDSNDPLTGHWTGTNNFGFAAYIGAYIYDGLDGSHNNLFKGSIAQIALWETALSDKAIKHIYNNGVPTNLKQTFGEYTNSDSLVGWWKMGDGVLNPDVWLEFEGADEATTTTDSSPHGLTCEFVENAEIEVDGGDSFLRLGSYTDSEVPVDRDYVKVAYHKSLDIGYDDFTIEFRVKFVNDDTSNMPDPAQLLAPLYLDGQYALFGQELSGSLDSYETAPGFFSLKYDFQKNDGTDGQWIIESGTDFDVDGIGGDVSGTTDNYKDLWTIDDKSGDTSNEVRKDVWYNIKIQRVNTGGIITQTFSRTLAAGTVAKTASTTREVAADPANHIFPVNFNSRKLVIGDWQGQGKGALDGYIDDFKVSRSNETVFSTFPTILDYSDNNNHGTMINMFPTQISNYASELTMIYPFVTKDSTSLAFKSVGEEEYQSFEHGDIIAGRYPMSAGISVEKFAEYVGQLSSPPTPAEEILLKRARPHIAALQNTLNRYKMLSPSYSFDNIKTAAATLVSIPSIFYGSSIEKGTVNLKYYLNGTLQAKGELKDSKKNGELLQDNGDGTTTVAGLVLYNEGFIILFGGDAHWKEKWGQEVVTGGTVGTGTITFSGGYPYPTTIVGDKITIVTPNSTIVATCNDTGSIGFEGGDVCEFQYNVNFSSIAATFAIILNYHPDLIVTHTAPNNYVTVAMAATGSGTSITYDDIDSSGPEISITYADGTDDVPDLTHSSSLSFNGTNRIPTLTMLAHAKKGELNHSNNPTYLTFDDKDGNVVLDSLGGTVYAELENLEIANTTKSPHSDAEATFQKQTWISKIGIYDENNNLIAIAKLANPVRKTEDRDFTFKLKLDF